MMQHKLQILDIVTIQTFLCATACHALHVLAIV